MLRLVANRLSVQKQAAKEMHKLTLAFPQFRAHFFEDELAIWNLLSPLELLDEDADTELQEEIIETVFNILTHNENIKGFVNNPYAISYVIKALDMGNAKTKNILKAIDGRAVKVILKKVSDGAYVYELWAILGILSTHGKTLLQIIELDGVRILLHNVRDSNDKASIKNTMTIFDWICSNDSKKLMEIQEEEKQYRTISWAARGGTLLAREGASRILIAVMLL
ncbi:hypothetical protein GIB67_004170 [Kingdonia uniflora]|uniref:Uncharacterized protein n=1 Tax=Kingdonia uniflora TaxID=39325 RepID=A0A7J7LLU0_9MAGN|nr:hypothetical protein GIB67_004170 [Kingdonia uniflora]